MTVRTLTREEGGSHWEIAMRPPAAPLRPYLASYVGYRESGFGQNTRREFTAKRIVFILDLGPPILIADGGHSGRYPRGFVAGLSDHFATTSHDGVQEGIHLDLSPVGARLLFGLPLTEITNRVVSLADVVPALHDLVDRVRDRPTWAERFDLLDALLLPRLPSTTLHAQVASWAVARIEAAHGDVVMRELARELGYSEKQVSRIFHDHVGVGPKRFARLVRFDGIIAALQHSPDARWAELAADHGFYDQSHLVREVRDLCGLTPTELRAARADLGDLFR